MVISYDLWHAGEEPAEAGWRRVSRIAMTQPLRDYIFAHDAVIVLPDSAKATWDLTSFPVP